MTWREELSTVAETAIGSGSTINCDRIVCQKSLALYIIAYEFSLSGSETSTLRSLVSSMTDLRILWSQGNQCCDSRYLPRLIQHCLLVRRPNYLLSCHGIHQWSSLHGFLLRGALKSHQVLLLALGRCRLRSSLHPKPVHKCRPLGLRTSKVLEQSIKII